MLPTLSENVTLQEAFETVAQINEELNITEFDGAFFQKKIRLLVNRFFSVLRQRKSVEKRIHQKNSSLGHRLSKIVNKAIAMTICPIIVHFITYRALMHDAACECLYAVRMDRNNLRERVVLTTLYHLMLH